MAGAGTHRTTTPASAKLFSRLNSLFICYFGCLLIGNCVLGEFLWQDRPFGYI